MPKKICFLEGDISRSGGTERITTEIANQLSDFNNKYEIHILSLVKQGDTNFFDIRESITTSVLFNQPNINMKRDYLYIVHCIRKYIKKHKIDVLIDVDTVLDVFSIPATRFTKTKFISWEHFNYYENLGVKYRDWGRRLSARYADALVTITDEDKGYFLKNLKPNCPVYSIYNPIPFRKNKHQYNIDSKIILSAGRLTYQKGFDMLIDVAKDVFENNPEWKWIILGEGEDRHILEEKIAEFNLKNHVILEGNVKNINNYYEQASIFVLTSRYEGFGLVLTEAKSHGLPCVSFKCKAGPSEIILDNINGYLIDCFNIKDMADKINCLIEDVKLREEFSDYALVDTEKFSKKNIILQWMNIMDNL